MLILREPFLSLWKDKDPFAEVEKISGNTVRALETRRTLRFEVDGQGFYLKLHHGTELVEVMKSLIRLRLPVLGADREWNAIHCLAEHGVDTMEGVAYGMKGGNPLARTSFIITKDLAPVTHLTGYFWNERPSCRVKRLIVKRVAQMVRDMHGCGVNHRDCYLVHFLIHLPFDSLAGKEEA